MRKDLLKGYCNQLALKLIQKQHHENKMAINQRSELLYQGINFQQWDTFLINWNSHFTMSPADKALMMVHLVQDKANVNQRQDKLADEESCYHSEEQDSDESVAKERPEEYFPWQTINQMNPFSRFSRIRMKAILTSFYKSHPKEVQKVLKKFNITYTELTNTFKNKEIKNRRSKLKMEVMSKAENGPISLNDFKYLARRIYSSPYFRPTDKWCHFFIKKERLQSSISSI